MDPHEPVPDDAKDEEQLAAALAASESAAAPPEAEFLAKLRAQSTDAFVAGSPLPVEPRKRPMFYRRWLAGAAAAVVLVGVSAYAWIALTSPSLTLGQAFDQFDQAGTLHARLVRGGKTYEFWQTSQPPRSRLDDLDGNYRIVDEGNSWTVRESTNEARRTAQPSSWRDMLGLPQGKGLENYVHALPADQVHEGDRELLTYRVDLPNLKETPKRLEATVDAKTGRLQSLRTLIERDGKSEVFASLTVVAYDQPIGAEKFKIADTLTEDGRIGKVGDVQGIVAIRPVLHERWTPLRENLVLKPGDWIRTDARGANAAALRLAKQTGVILGPKTLVELVSPKTIRLVEGQLEIVPTTGTTIELLGPNQQKVAVKDRQFYRVENAKNASQLVRVEKDPPWLLGFKGATANESLGSLVALVDGRNVPLTVGYHKVTVDIRDQIARTVIEESFVNHTKTELEGVFHFPLPQDASISGFGMWIGDNYVEADVVEKQRAREIFETILREKRDPGLLEWSGGNLFKARVFPIPPNAEKRIKITYTQVLPLKGSRYRYSYALQSDMLQQHPLRELNLDVKVNSAVPLRSVSSPTHTTRDARTAHSAHVEFSAQEYTPTRDFEVVVEVEGRQSDVVMIPHRRGDDGYFMLQLTPPGAGGDWDRPILPNGEPLHLLVLADTSASIDAGQRAAQATFVASLLASLSPKDTFNLATCDVTCDWAFVMPASAEASQVVAARDFLARRTSLGWTNLDVAFASALKQCGPKTHVVYVGDGIVTSGDGDPVAFAKRLRRLHQGGAVFHAVTLGSTYEAGVMKAIASLGSGSMRRISSEQGPPAIARELLAEIAQPALRDVKVEFKGFKAARVYPESLANVPAGTQQILLGRYLPDGKDQAGEVVVTGMQGDKPVRFTARASFKDAELGNAFIPRLWARMHLDSLLEQGASSAVKDEIIGLSEEFQIITPYTSLLVLETDADRERFKMKRRFLMRDGERFFADGRDNAVFDLAQKQRKAAADWRTALRRAVLADLAKLGRGPIGSRRMEFPMPVKRDSNKWFLRGGRAEVAFKDMFLELGDLGDISAGFAPSERLSAEVREFDRFGVVDESRSMDGLSDFFSDEAKKEEWGLEMEFQSVEERLVLNDPIRALNDASPFFFDEANGSPLNMQTERIRVLALDFAPTGGTHRLLRRGHSSWLNMLFPTLTPIPAKSKPAKSAWPAAARELAASLLRSEQIAKMAGGVEIVRQTDTFEPRWGELATRSRRLDLASAKTWLVRTASDGGQTLVSWNDGKEVGAFSKAFQLGRTRAATPLDGTLQLALGDHSAVSVEREFASYTPTVEAQGKDRALLVLKVHRYETRILVDTVRHVVLSVENRDNGKLFDTTKFDDFVEVAGGWWARKIEATNADGKRTSLATQTVKSLTPDELAQRTKTELVGRDAVQFLHLPLPSVAAAKKAHAAGKATFGDEFLLMLHFHASQQWDKVLDHLQRAEKAAQGKPGLRWLRAAILNDSRRHDELRLWQLQEAARVAKDAGAEAYFLAGHLLDTSARVLQHAESLALLDALRPTHDKQPPHLQARKHWLLHRLAHLASDEAAKLRKQLADDHPRDVALQRDHAQALAAAGDYAGAYAWLTRALGKDAKWNDGEEAALLTAYAALLEQQGRYADLADYLAAWVERGPANLSAYAQLLRALVLTDQPQKAEAFALRWLQEAHATKEATDPVVSRLRAAVDHLSGETRRSFTGHPGPVEDRWLDPLAKAALDFALHPRLHDTTSSILSHLRNTDEIGPLRKALGAVFVRDLDKLSVAQIRRFHGWLNNDTLDKAAWDRVVAALRQRWTKSSDEDEKHDLGDFLAIILASFGSESEPLAFLRLQRLTGPEKHRAEYAGRLFERLLGAPWTAAIEDESLALLDKQSDAEEPGERLVAAVSAAHRLTDRMLANRVAAAAGAIEHPEKLSRTDLQKKHADLRRAAREALADRLFKESAKRPKALAAWLVAESVYLDVPLDRSLKRAVAEAWEVMGAAPKKRIDEPTIEQALEAALRQRHLVTLTNLAARKGAEPALVERLVKHHDQAIEAEGKEGSAGWKSAKMRLLIALDRNKELEVSLRQWSAQDDDNHWRLALGHLLAEQGKLAEAIQQFEAADELGPREYRSLADWLLIQGQRAASERAALKVYQTTSEQQLSRMIAAKMAPWHSRDGKLPTELDPEVLRLFAVLFDKSATPHAYLHQLQQSYQASHDFRLLSGLPDAVVGHTAAKVYPFLGGMQSVLDEVRDEATADEIVKRIAEVRPHAKTAVDERALDLLEAQVERRASELLNQPGPHREKALAALQRAFKRAWSPGEPRRMAELLAGLGAISQPALADEQLRQLKALHADSAAGSLDRFQIAHCHARTLRGRGRVADATDVMQAALDEFEAANQGVLPVVANAALDTYVDLLVSAGHFARGETVLLAQLKHPAHSQQRRWLVERLDAHYLRALQHKADVSLGKGAELYQALAARIRKALADPDANHRHQLVSLLMRTYDSAHDLKIPGVAADLKGFVAKALPPLLKEQTSGRDSMVGAVASTLRSVAGPREGIVFLLDEIDREPRWLRHLGRDGWRVHGGSLLGWFEETKEMADVKGRLLKLVLAELRRSVERREELPHHRVDYHFWKTNRADYEKVAEEVLAQRKHSNLTAQHVADYLVHTLDLRKRATEILFVSHGQKRLDEAGQGKLVNYLHREKRHGESIALLQPLVERQPESMSYRTLLMHSYFRTDRKAELLALLKQTDAHFHEKGRWGEGPLSQLAHSMLENELYEPSVAYYKELIPLHERSRANRGVGDGELAAYYQGLARAYAGLKKTPEAVDAAGGAVVAWGGHADGRAKALDTLKSVLVQSPDLDAFVAHFDQQKLKNPVVCKAIGQAYQEMKQHAKAIKQWELAVELQPNDAEVFTLLVAAHDALGDREGAVRQLLQAVQHSRRDLKLFESLAKRYDALKQPGEAERAYTSIVEVQSTETESHAMLAEIREKQNRWPEAIAHWEQVAKLRELEPTGLLKLAAAQIHEQQWDKARESLRRLDARSWPPRFENVRQQTRALEEKIKK